jgi:hypothetical protein
MHAAFGGDIGGIARRVQPRWWLLVPAFLLFCLSAFLFVKFLGAAFFFSDWGPITSATPAKKAVQLADAKHRADIFFLLSTAVTALAALVIVPVIQLNSIIIIRSRGLRLIARCVLALVLSVVIAGTLVWIFGVLKIG